MKLIFKITRKLFDEIRNDLARPHHYAYERVGWIRCRPSPLPQNGLLILAHDYYPVGEHAYIKSKDAAATINSDAIRKALQLALDQKVSMFHVHLHGHTGPTWFSEIDSRENRKLIPDFWNVRPELPHGAVVFSNTDINGQCWYDKGKIYTITTATIVGFPIGSTDKYK